MAVIAGVLFGNATEGLAESYHEIELGESQPEAVRVVVLPETEMVEGEATGLVGTGVEFTVTTV